MSKHGLHASADIISYRAAPLQVPVKELEPEVVPPRVKDFLDANICGAHYEQPSLLRQHLEKVVLSWCRLSSLIH